MPKPWTGEPKASLFSRCHERTGFYSSHYARRPDPVRLGVAATRSPPASALSSCGPTERPSGALPPICEDAPLASRNPEHRSLRGAPIRPRASASRAGYNRLLRRTGMPAHPAPGLWQHASVQFANVPSRRPSPSPQAKMEACCLRGNQGPWRSCTRAVLQTTSLQVRTWPSTALRLPLLCQLPPVAVDGRGASFCVWAPARRAGASAGAVSASAAAAIIVMRQRQAAQQQPKPQSRPPFRGQRSEGWQTSQ
jgi:hypothetical protein